MIRRALAIAATVALVTIAAPAYAETVTPRPTINAVPAEPATGPVQVRLQVAGNPWAIRNVASVYDHAIPGVQIRAGRCVASAVCIRVQVANYGPTRWYGYWNATRDMENHTIRLNTYYLRARDGQAAIRPRNTACHELGHALGLNHHHAQGCMKFQSIRALNPSHAELATLRTAYRR